MTWSAQSDAILATTYAAAGIHAALVPSSPSAIVHCAMGAPTIAACRAHVPFRCWVCGANASRGMDRRKWMGANFVGQNRVRAPASSIVCEACVAVMGGRPPDTLRMTSHLWDSRGWLRPNKGAKPAIRAWLRGPKVGGWFAAIADSGKKHIVPWAPMQAACATVGSVLFEERVVSIGDWQLVDDMTALLTARVTKDEVGPGSYGPRSWRSETAAIRAFEARWANERAGGWFDLGLWLAQRDEENR